MKRITAWAAVLTLTLSLLTGCAQIDESSADELPFPSEETPAEEEHSGLPAVFALPYLEGQPLNPLTCPDGVQQTVASLLYEGLFRLDQTFTPQPLLCASYTYDPETLTYKLTLRDGVVFSDGSPLTAADVKATLNAARSSARYARRLSDVKSISAGDGAVTLTLNRPNTGLPALLDIPILKSGTEKHSVPLGTGPYLYDESSESCLIASQNWWRHLSQPVERISLTGTADQESMLYRFSSRDVQLIVADLTGTDPVAVSGSVSYDDADTTVFQYLGINVSAKGLDDAAFRRCLSLGVSRRALVSSLLSGHAKAAQFPVSPVSPLYPADLEQTDSVVAFTDALNACETRPSRTLRLLVNSENSFKVSAANAIAQALSAFDLDIEVKALPWAEYTAALAAGQFDLYYGEIKLTADWNLTALLGTGGSANYGKWADPQTDALLASCAAAADRAAAIHTLCAHLRSECPIIPICFKSTSVLVQDGVVDGLQPTMANPFYDFSSCTVHLQA